MRLIGNWRKTRDKFPKRHGTNGSIKSFPLYSIWLINSKAICSWLKSGDNYVFLLILKKKTAKCKNRRYHKSSQILMSGVSQGPILSQIIFHIFLNDLVQVLKNSDIYNFADGNTISVAPKNRDTLLETLINKSRLVVNWSRNNNLTVNPNKLMLLQKFGNSFYRQPPFPTRSVEF